MSRIDEHEIEPLIFLDFLGRSDYEDALVRISWAIPSRNTAARAGRRRLSPCHQSGSGRSMNPSIFQVPTNWARQKAPQSGRSEESHTRDTRAVTEGPRGACEKFVLDTRSKSLLWPAMKQTDRVRTRGRFAAWP